MESEVIRFMTLRPTQVTKSQSNLITVSLLNPNDNVMKDALIKAGILNIERNKIMSVAKAYIANPAFYNDVSKINPLLIDFINWISAQKKIPSSSVVLTKVSQLYPGGIGPFIASPDFQKDRVNVTISLIVATIVPNGTITLRPQLLDSFRAIAALITLSQYPDLTTDFEGLFNRTVLFPKNLVPLYDNSVAQKKIQNEKDNIKKIEAQNKLAVQNLIHQINLNKSALEELSGAYLQHINLLERQTLTKTIANVAATDSNPSSPLTVATPIISKLNFSFLPPEIVSKISTKTKTVLSTVFIDTDMIDVYDAKTKITEQSKVLVNHLFAIQNKNTEITYMGKTPVIVKPLPGNFGIPVIFPPVSSSMPTGPCATEPETTEDDLTTDNWNTKGIIPVLYIGDLQKVRQSLARYELGEIAHIENVLKGESKSNILRRLDKTIQVNVTENETQSETEKDLHTQDQFDLQTQASKTIAQSKSFDAGLTVTGSYGPSLTATATANYSQQDSARQSAQTSANYAREVISNSVQKIKERVFSSRTTTNIEKVKVINKHELNNASGADHIRGIYQWVNKIYRLQIINYGKRWMLEFTIPDPAAFYRYALTSKPNEEATLIKPDVPGSCVNGIFQPLAATDIDEINAPIYASKYGATDIKPCPELQKIITWNNSVNIDQSDSNKPNKITADSTNPITIQDGYMISLVNYNVQVMRNDVGATNGSTDGVNRDQIEFSVMIGTHEIRHVSLSEWPDNTQLYNQDYASLETGFLTDFNGQADVLPVSITGFSTLAIAINIGLKVACTLNPKAKEQWQIDTFNSIMAGYNNLKAQYDRDMKAQQFDNIASIQGRNPLLNREIEKVELKKSVLSQLTGQNYEYFNSMKYNMPPLGYPQMDIIDAEDEGNYIRFFEQAFEWENMTYLFYPYFWANKKNWPMLLQIEDNDPLFEKFLQAGSARVQVPVRPGFEIPVSTYIQNGGTPWLHHDAPQNDGQEDAPFLAMIDEIKAQYGFEFNELNPGTISVTRDSKVVTGTGTNFIPVDLVTHIIIPDYNVDREILILGKSYRIQSVESNTSITLREAYDSDSQTNIGYYLGGKFVGEFWEELIPTELVYLAKDDLIN